MATKRTKEEVRCPKCRALRSSVEYFSGRKACKGSDLEGACRACVGKAIGDPKDPDRVEAMCREFDMPFSEKLWIMNYNKAVEKNPDDMTPQALFGRYIRLMGMRQYQAFNTYDKQDELCRYMEDKHPEPFYYAEPPSEEELAAKQAKSKDVIDKAAEKIAKQMLREKEEKQQAEEAAQFKYSFSANDQEQRIYDNLEPSDVEMLVAKWGCDFLPSEWVKMENLYNRYVNEYDMNIDREQTLIAICKTTVKMDQALAQGNVADYQKLASVLKDLRTSAKFTESQKVEKKRYIDSIGELVAFCEKEGGIIPQYGDPDDYPQDVVDFTLNNLKSYTYNLVANELGMGSMIESYIKKLQEVESSDIDALTIGPTTADEKTEDFMNDLAAADWTQYLDSGIDEEIDGILKQVSF